VVFSLVALVITAANVFWFSTFTPSVADSFLWLATFNQLIASAFALLGLRRFSGQRLRPNYKIGRPPIWTLRWAFAIVTLIASLGAILLTTSRFTGW